MRRSSAVVLVVVGLLLGLVGSGPVFMACASFVQSPTVLGGLTTLFVMLVVGLATWGASRVVRSPRAAALAAAASVVAGVLFFGALYVLLLRPPAQTIPVLVAGPDVKYWQLPTGSRIAYVKSAAVGERRPEPVIFLHGGPGIPVLPTFAVLGKRPALDTLTALGHDVYYYDQLGCGYSSRLDLRTGVNYTIGRYVADLDAIREALGAEQVVLVGVSMGAVLASRYMLEHPDRVAKVVFVSPGSIAPDPRGFDVDFLPGPPLSAADSLRFVRDTRPTLRFAVARQLGMRRSPAAFRLVSDWEADDWYERQMAASIRVSRARMSCSDSANRALAQLGANGRSGVGFFCSNFVMEDICSRPDPRPQLRGNPTPALVLRGECDYIAWPVAREYRRTFPNAKLLPIPAAGHIIDLDQPELYARIVTAFVSGAPLPIADYAAEDSPW